ncbi:bifunctional proline dehydrogenase/L-glutamate gamma-semialdehyde dehydrogenase [Branchiibius sp. NY16-3462-2]|uniref:bifunctional proline dehydrogenase/L-glutamate gamma-semialdehyde dehydrogenase n=1 Tax=Branchiibius sp. NY16-3462-2 TaxID=1807500 RepID=UPI000A51B5E7|nr:bifunctional proline dehydrogenase/L-glutamate gamma-semialdehyde dehydrogenase [Branchiibius sp. NY16-3462-2]
MTDIVLPTTAELDALADQARALVQRWLEAAAALPTDRSAQQLADVLRDPDGLPFTVGFVDGVIRPEDPAVAAENFAALAADVPGFLPWYLRSAVKLGARAGSVAPAAVIPVVRRSLRQMVGHLIVDASDARLGKAIAKIRRDGVRLNLNLLGEAVLGEQEADRRLAGTLKLLGRDDVDYVSIKVSSTVAPHPEWAFDEAVEHVVDKLLPLYQLAAQSSPAKFINLDMEEYHDLDLTIAVFTAILDRPEFLSLEAGIVLQAYLPDALSAMIRLQDWSAARRARGGAPIKVRLVKGANLPMEQVESSLHGWPLATWGSKQDSDTNYKRVLNYAMQPERIANVRVGVAGHNLFDVAFAWLLAGQRGVRDGIEFEMLLGMATSQAEAVRREVGNLLLYTPVVHPGEFDVAIAYLIRRLEEGASQDNFMSAVFELHSDSALFEREWQRFLASLHALDAQVPDPNRVQDRSTEVIETQADFANVPDTDPSTPGNRSWGRAIQQRIAASDVGADLVREHTVTDPAVLDSAIAAAVAAGQEWGARSGADRAAILRQAAVELQRARAELIEVMGAEAGKTIDQSDPEVSEAVDFANYYAELAENLDEVQGASRSAYALTVVTPPWNFPVAIPAGSTLAALAAGSAVIIKPAPSAARCGSVMVDALWRAGVPREVLHLVHVAENDLGTRLVSDERVDQLILTGAYETAELFRSFRPDLRLHAETSGKNAIIVTPSADLDLAVKDVVSSAFGHAGQKCSAASLVILVGSVATSRRFNQQLVDAVRSLTVGYPSDPNTQMGPLIEPASGKLLRALTTLDDGEEWVVQPRQLDDSGQLWSPGVKKGVKPGSTSHLTEFFGPVLSIMTAETLTEAIELQNAVDYGLTAGLHSLERDELSLWLDRVQAGNLYVNRHITGAIVRRQPFGGWKKSAVGPGTKAGGPNYLVGLTGWNPTTDLAEGAASDAEAWSQEFSQARDVSGLTAERNVFRYRPVPTVIRAGTDADPDAVLRVLSAATTAWQGGSVRGVLSCATALPDTVIDAARAAGVPVQVQSDKDWLGGLAGGPGRRIRLIGGSASAICEATGGRPDIAVYDQPVTAAGRVEMLPFLHEQAVSITAHRFGTPNHLSDGLL